MKLPGSKCVSSLTVFSLFLDFFLIDLLEQYPFFLRLMWTPVRQASRCIRQKLSYDWLLLPQTGTKWSGQEAMQVQAASPSAPTLHSRPARHTIILHSSIHHAEHIYLRIHCENLLLKDWMVWLCIPSPKLSSSAFSYLNQGRKRIIYQQVQNKPFSFPYKKKKEKKDFLYLAKKAIAVKRD